MKFKIFFFIIIVLFTTKLNAQIKLGSYATTQDPGSTYPTHLDSLGQGGLMSLSTIASRDALIIRRRKQGMLVYVQSNDSLYKLTTADLSNTGWVAVGLLTPKQLTDFVNNSVKGLTNANLSGTAGITDANLATISTVGKVSNSATSATASNTSYTIVSRDDIGNFSANTITANLNGTALIATNIQGGAVGSLPYQTANNTTGLLAAGTNGQVLQLASGIPSWTTLPTTLSASNVTGILAVANGGTGQSTIGGIQSALGLAGTNVTIGTLAGTSTQSSNAIAIGNNAGKSNQGFASISIGSNAGETSQSGNSVAIGFAAAQAAQKSNSVAIGDYAGYSEQGKNSVAIGSNAGKTTQADNSVAIGAYTVAGFTNSTAIGYGAVVTSANTIQLGADGSNGVGGSTTAIDNVKTSGTLTAGTVTYPKTHGTNGQLLTTTGSGTLTWTSNVIPYTGANRSVNLGAYDLTVNGLTIGLGAGAIATNTVIGIGALSNINNSGTNNNAIGYNALKSNTIGVSNIANGASSLYTNSSGSYNIATGVNALYWNSSGSHNIATGVSATLLEPVLE
jgi:trimeric autotransporter adhesin